MRNLNKSRNFPNSNDAAKKVTSIELLVHISRSKKLYAALHNKSSEKAQLAEHHVLSIAIDFLQSISFSKGPVQELFYLRQLTINVFCISDIKNETRTLFVYKQTEAKEGSNGVCSFLYAYLKDITKNQYLSWGFF